MAFLKLVSGILGTDFDRLYQRERRRSSQRLALLAGIASTVAVILGVLAVVAFSQARLAQRNANRAALNEKVAARNEQIAAGERDKAVKLLRRSVTAERLAQDNAGRAQHSADAARQSEARALKSAEEARREQAAAVRAREAALDALNRTATRLADDRYRENPALAAMQRDVLGDLMPVYTRLLGEPGRDASAVASYGRALDGLAGLQADWVSIEQANTDYSRLMLALSSQDLAADPMIAALRDRIVMRHTALLISYGDGQRARAQLSTMSAAARQTAEARCLTFRGQTLLDGSPLDVREQRDDARDAVLLATGDDFDTGAWKIECELAAAASYAMNNEYDDAFNLTGMAAREIERLQSRYTSSPTLSVLSIRRRLADIDLVHDASTITPPKAAGQPSDVPARRQMPPATEREAYLRREYEELDKEIAAAEQTAPGNRRLLEAKFLVQSAEIRSGFDKQLLDPAWLVTAETLISRDPGSRAIAEALSQITGFLPPTSDPNARIAGCDQRIARAEQLSRSFPEAYVAQRLLVSSYRCMGTLVSDYPQRDDLRQRYSDMIEKIDAASATLIAGFGTEQSTLRMGLLDDTTDMIMSRAVDRRRVFSLVEHYRAEAKRFPDALRPVAANYVLVAGAARVAIEEGKADLGRHLMESVACQANSLRQHIVCAALDQEVARGLYGAALAKLIRPDPRAPQYLLGWVGPPYANGRPNSLEAGLMMQHPPVEILTVEKGRVIGLDDIDYARGALDPGTLERQHRMRAEVDSHVQRMVDVGMSARRAYRLYRFGEGDTPEAAAQVAKRPKKASPMAPDPVPLATPVEPIAAPTNSERGRIGLGIELRNGTPTVVRVEKDGPAMRAGLKIGDRIVKVSDEPTYGIELEATIARIQGPPGTMVKLLLTRSGEPAPVSVDIRRERIVITPESAATPAASATTAPAPSDSAPSAGVTWRTSAFKADRTQAEIDDDLLNEKVVIMLQGKNIYGDQIYTYLQLTLNSLQDMRDMMRAEKDFMPKDFGTVLAAGKGAPSRKTRAWLAELHNMVEVPRSRASEGGLFSE
ncbi:PDZ domain-containing protein [Rhizorhabdus dicambivorans]